VPRLTNRVLNSLLVRKIALNELRKRVIRVKMKYKI